jgi:hypothetical protein
VSQSSIHRPPDTEYRSLDGRPDHPLLAEAFEEYWSRIATADRIYASASLHQPQAGGDQEHSLRRSYVHLIEEYARDCGHADLNRQAIDGAIGD